MRPVCYQITALLLCLLCVPGAVYAVGLQGSPGALQLLPGAAAAVQLCFTGADLGSIRARVAVDDPAVARCDRSTLQVYATAQGCSALYATCTLVALNPGQTTVSVTVTEALDWQGNPLPGAVLTLPLSVAAQPTALPTPYPAVTVPIPTAAPTADTTALPDMPGQSPAATEPGPTSPGTASATASAQPLGPGAATTAPGHSAGNTAAPSVRPGHSTGDTPADQTLLPTQAHGHAATPGLATAAACTPVATLPQMPGVPNHARPAGGTILLLAGAGLAAVWMAALGGWLLGRRQAK